MHNTVMFMMITFKIGGDLAWAQIPATQSMTMPEATVKRNLLRSTPTAAYRSPNYRPAVLLYPGLSPLRQLDPLRERRSMLDSPLAAR